MYVNTDAVSCSHVVNANIWRELQRDMSILMSELGNCHLRTGETSVGQTGENTASCLNLIKRRFL